MVKKALLPTVSEDTTGGIPTMELCLGMKWDYRDIFPESIIFALRSSLSVEYKKGALVHETEAPLSFAPLAIPMAVPSWVSNGFSASESP